jgi:hypothetical protein
MEICCNPVSIKLVEIIFSFSGVYRSSQMEDDEWEKTGMIATHALNRKQF